MLKNQDLLNKKKQKGLLTNLGIRTPLSNSNIRRYLVLNAIPLKIIK